MNVLFLMIIPPDMKRNPNLYTELMEEFRDNGHSVYVAAIDEKKNGRQTRLAEDSGIEILHIRTGNMFNVKPIEKGLTMLSLGRLFNNGLKTYFANIKFDIVLMPTPPITFSAAMNYIKQRDGAKSYLILRDIFPQNAKDIGLLNNEIIFKFFRKKEKAMYKASDYIGCMSQGNIDYVLKHNPEVDSRKLELLPNWSRVENVSKQENQDANATAIKEERQGIAKVDYKKKYELDGKFVCIFGGNIGWPQELEFLMELAKSVRDRKDILFLIVGKGITKPKIEKIVEEEKLTNVMLKDYLPKEDYEGLVEQCDVGLINLDRRFTIPNIPSKTTSYFKAGIPVLASVDNNTDYGKILEVSKAGLWSITGDLKAYKMNLLHLADNPDEAKNMGTNGRRYLEKYLTVTKAYNTIMGHFDGSSK